MSLDPADRGVRATGKFEVTVICGGWVEMLI
jgi:hypothetical protein